MESILNAVNAFCQQQGSQKTYWIAYSGGLDSHVLLHAFAQLPSINIRVVHVNHGLSVNANDWVKHCETICNALHLPFHHHLLTLEIPAGESLEEKAREQRYAVFSNLLAENDILVTAHHQNDQAETLLLQMLRGAGPKGLSAMPRIKPFATGWHARPLLDFSRDQLQQYALHHHLHWIEDESNAALHFSRNFIRHEVMSVLQQRWPSVSSTLSRVADHCAEAQTILDDVARNDFLQVQGSVADTLSVAKILQLSEPRQRQVLRFWFQQLQIPLPSKIKLQHIQQDLLQAREDKLPHLTWENVEIRRYRDDIYIQPVKEKSAVMNPEWLWDFQQPLILCSQQKLDWCWRQGEGLREDIREVKVMFRQGQERLQLPGRQHRHELKKLFQAWCVPPWQRDSIPLVYVENELIAVVGFFIDPRFAAGTDEQGRWLFVPLTDAS